MDLARSEGPKIQIRTATEDAKPNLTFLDRLLSST